MTVNGFPIDMELDTGASLLVMSEEMFAKLHSNGKLPKLQKTETVLHTYTGEKVKPRGSLDVMVSYENKEYKLPLLIVQGHGPALLGRNWLNKITLNWHAIKKLSPVNQHLGKVVRKYLQLFEEGLGSLKEITSKIQRSACKWS